MRSWFHGLFAPVLPIVACMVIGTLVCSSIPIIRSVRAMQAEINESHEWAGKNVKSTEQWRSEQFASQFN